MSSFYTKITDKFLANIGLFDNLLGRYAPLVAVDQRKERLKKIISEVYGYTDIYDLIPERLDHQAVNTTLKTIFNHHEEIHELEEKNKKN